jgi:lipopolysaccharide/colanic/teichoic acid biosynthesis glycosyltransferase
MVHQVKPGITDNSSIFYRSEESLLAGSDDPEKTYKEIILPKKLDLYEDYVVNNSFLGDLKLIFKTIFTVIFK